MTPLICAALGGCAGTLGSLNPLNLPAVANVLNAADEPPTDIYLQNRNRWQQAALRQNDLFNRHGLKILAGIRWKKRTDATTYQFENIRIGNQTDAYTLNLLAPQFEQTMACGWYCEYLNQPLTQTVLGRYTMLDKLFEGQQTELLNFYDSLKRLNERLLSLKADYRQLLPEIIGQLAQQQNQFASLNDAIGFINDHFDDIDFQDDFEQQLGIAPAAPQTIAGASDSSTNEEDASTNNEIVAINTLPPANVTGPKIAQQAATDNSDPDRALLASFNAAPDMAQMLAANPPVTAAGQPQLPERFEAQAPALPQPDGQQYAENQTTDNSSWSLLKRQTITMGQLVCAYQDNTFGHVERIGGENITVALKGQGKALKDGLLVDLEPGTLFLIDADFSYLSREENKIFRRSQIAPCYLSGF